jgi:hypothetical protein
MKIEQSVNDKGEAVFTAIVPIPEGVDPEWFAQYFERALSHELECLRSGIEAQLDDAADGYSLPDEFDDDGKCDFDDEDVVT